MGELAQGGMPRTVHSALLYGPGGTVIRLHMRQD
jgi:hypothetical protein